MAQITCPTCNGTKKEKCFFCDGSGRDPWNYEEHGQCTGCGGSGELKCKTCKGEGVIKTGDSS